MDRAERKRVIQETLDACRLGGHQSPSGAWVTVNDTEMTESRGGRMHRLEEFTDQPHAQFQSRALLHVEENLFRRSNDYRSLEPSADRPQKFSIHCQSLPVSIVRMSM